MQPYKTDPPIAVLYFCPRLGFEHVPWEAFMTQVLAMGYDGIELGVPASIDERTLDQIWECAWRRSVQLILRHSDTGSADFNEHYDQYGAWWERIKCYPCVNVISETDRDRFSVEQNRALIALAGPETVQAIHRERFSYSPRVTCEYLLADPDLRLSFDISQWIDGTGSCLDDQIEAVDLAIERSGHIEACSGFPEAQEIYLDYWKRIARRYLGQGEPEPLTISTGSVDLLQRLKTDLAPGKLSLVESR